MWSYVFIYWDQLHKLFADSAIQSFCAVISLVMPILVYIYKRIKTTKPYLFLCKVFSVVFYTALYLFELLICTEIMSVISDGVLLPFDHAIAVAITIVETSLVIIPTGALLIFVVFFVVPKLLNLLRRVYARSTIGKRLKKPKLFGPFCLSTLEIKLIYIIEAIVVLLGIYTAISIPPQNYLPIEGAPRILNYVANFICSIYFFGMSYALLSLFLIFGIHLFVRHYWHKDIDSPAQHKIIVIRQKSPSTKRYIPIQERERQARSRPDRTGS